MYVNYIDQFKSFLESHDMQPCIIDGDEIKCYEKNISNCELQLETAKKAVKFAFAFYVLNLSLVNFILRLKN